MKLLFMITALTIGYAFAIRSQKEKKAKRMADAQMRELEIQKKLDIEISPEAKAVLQEELRKAREDFHRAKF